MIYGYVRTSRSKQNPERQIRNIIQQYPDAKIVQEVYTRMSLDRKEWKKLVSRVRQGDTIVFDSVSRMSGNAEEGMDAYEELYNRGVSLVFLKEPHINTDTYKKSLEGLVTLTNTDVDYILEGVNKYLITLAREQVKLAFIQSEKEVDDLHQRTREGIETARLEGKQIGQKRGAKLKTKVGQRTLEDIQRYSKDFGGTMSDAELLRLTGVARNTLYKYKRQLRDEQFMAFFRENPNRCYTVGELAETLHIPRSLAFKYIGAWMESGLIAEDQEKREVLLSNGEKREVTLYKVLAQKEERFDQ